MKGYVDMYLLTLPKKNLTEYRKQAAVFAKLFKKHGGLAYREFQGDDLTIKGCPSYKKLVNVKSNEIIITAMAEFKSRKHRDEVNKKMFTDPAMDKMMEQSAPLFDMKKMYYGGFAPFISI